jgi:hypothetical protein
MRALVLTYHSQNVNGKTYADNDHIALQSDLAVLRRAGIAVVSAEALAQSLTAQTMALPERCVVLTCDDGTLLDWEAFEHPAHGSQPSFAQILRDAIAEGLNAPRQGALTSFVIASDEARAAIDVESHAGYPISTSAWWAGAARDGLIHLGCHSWDHCAHGLTPAHRYSKQAGTFRAVDNLRDADQQVRHAGEAIRARCSDDTQARLFAYPYGETTDYLVNTYFPNAAHGMLAAFTDGAEVVTAATHRWTIPRYVCGHHWRSADAFAQLIGVL